MRHEHDGQATLAVEPRDRLHDRRRRAGVDAGGRLVEQQELRLGGERPRDQDALLLAAGQRPERMRRERGESHLGQAFGRAPPLATAHRPER